jgi:hypothetical protein
MGTSTPAGYSNVAGRGNDCDDADNDFLTRGTLTFISTHAIFLNHLSVDHFFAVWAKPSGFWFTHFHFLMQLATLANITRIGFV